MSDLEDNPLTAVSRVAGPEREHMRLSEEALVRRRSGRVPDGVD